MADNTDNPAETWANMVSRHGHKRPVVINKRNLVKHTDIPLIGSILYEDDTLKAQILANKAMSIIQQSLSDESVLFSFPKGLFSDRIDAYKLIQQQLSSGVEFRPLSLYDDHADGSLLIEAKFCDIDNARQALLKGVSINDVVYKASPTKKTKTTKYGELTHVQFTLLRMVDQNIFLADLIESISYYGRVLQVKQYTRQGFFEGQLSVILDTSVCHEFGDGIPQQPKPLSRMLYLCLFDCFVPATYKGAPPICHFCHQSGHIRSGCPQLAKRKCFGCDQPGHIVRFCPEGKQALVLNLDEADEETKAPETNQEDIEDRLSDDECEDESVEEHVNDDAVPESEEDMECELNEEEEEVQLACATAPGSLYSKHAPESVALSMKVDPPEEKVNRTKQLDSLQRKSLSTKSLHRRKRQEVLDREERTHRN
jgi:hypothetical protein